MARKERCPSCGSKKIVIQPDDKKECKVCKHAWKYRAKRRSAKKGKVRFR